MVITTAQAGFTKFEPSDEGPLLLIEQAPWPPNTGLVSKANILRGVISILSSAPGKQSTIFRPEVGCGIGEDGELKTAVYVYLYDTELVYNLKATNGVLSDGMIQQGYSVTETLRFSKSNSVSLKYPCHSVKSIDWKGYVYDKTHTEIPAPATTNNLYKLYTEQLVYGTVKITYHTYRLMYGLSVPAIPDSIENVFDSVVYAYYDGGVVWLVINIPEGSDEFQNEEKICGYRFLFGPGDPESWPPAYPGGTVDKTTVTDYCSQQIKSVSIS